MCLLSNNVTDYNFVAQGKTTIPNVDDAEECRLTDVSGWGNQPAKKNISYFDWLKTAIVRSWTIRTWPQIELIFKLLNVLSPIRKQNDTLMSTHNT